jgi:hypothetical protein
MSEPVCPTTYVAPHGLPWCVERLASEANAVRWWDKQMLDAADPADQCWPNAIGARNNRDYAALQALVWLLTWAAS